MKSIEWDITDLRYNPRNDTILFFSMCFYQCFLNIILLEFCDMALLIPEKHESGLNFIQMKQNLQKLVNSVSVTLMILPFFLKEKNFLGSGLANRLEMLNKFSISWSMLPEKVVMHSIIILWGEILFSLTLCRDRNSSDVHLRYSQAKEELLIRTLLLSMWNHR